MQPMQPIYCRFTLTSITPLLMHADDVMMADELSLFRSNMTKGQKKAGDDRSPAWSWHTYVYHDEEHVVWPAQNVMVCLRKAASDVIFKGQKTFKELSQSGLVIPDLNLKFRTPKGQVPWSIIHQWRQSGATFMEQSKAITQFDPNIRLHVTRAKIGTSKHVRVRPRFEEWNVEGTIVITSPDIPFDRLVEFFEIGGDRVGLGDWRPSSKTPGPYGRFKAEVKLVKK